MAHHIAICLGSSCFARGASRYPALIQAFLAERTLTAELSGHLCRSLCPGGPIVAIDGVEHQVRDEAALQLLLEATFNAPVEG